MVYVNTKRGYQSRRGRTVGRGGNRGNVRGRGSDSEPRQARTSIAVPNAEIMKMISDVGTAMMALSKSLNMVLPKGDHKASKPNDEGKANKAPSDVQAGKPTFRGNQKGSKKPQTGQSIGSKGSSAKKAPENLKGQSADQKQTGQPGVKNGQPKGPKGPSKKKTPLAKDLNGKPAQKPDAANGKDNGQPHDETVLQSRNQDFAAMAKTLFKAVQLRHHLSNWEHVPERLAARIDSLMTDIRPPMADDRLQAELYGLGMEFCSRIRQTVQDHLDRMTATVADKAGSLDPSDLDRARSIASKYATQRLGRRLTTERCKEYLDDAVNLVGVSKKATHPIDIDTVRDNPVEPGTPLVLAETPHKRKATSPLAQDPATIAGSPTGELSDVEPEGQQWTTVSPRRSKKARRTECSKVTRDNGVIVYTCNPDDWVIEPTGNKEFLLIADSNMREATNVPPGYEIHCMPGATLERTTMALKRMKSNRKYRVKIQVGINNRYDPVEFIDQAVQQIAVTLSEHPCVSCSAAIGVSRPLSLPGKQSAAIDYLNTMLRVSFGEPSWIPPLPLGTVRIHASDRYGIHHQGETISAILKTLVDYDSDFFGDTA